MLFLMCPYCEDRFILEIGYGGMFYKYTCSQCKQLIFIHHSRWRPHVYKPDQVRVDEKSRKIEIIDLEALADFESDYNEGIQAMKEIKTVLPKETGK